jgi:hypothetical protein
MIFIVQIDELWKSRRSASPRWARYVDIPVLLFKRGRQVTSLRLSGDGCEAAPEDDRRSPQPLATADFVIARP